MIIGEVDFIDRFLRGENADAIMQGAAHDLAEDLAARTNELVQSRVSARQALAVELQAIARQVDEAPFLEKELQAIQLAKEAIEQLSTEQKKLKDRVEGDRNMVKHNREIIAVLQTHLVELQQMLAILRDTPSYHEKKIKQLGERISWAMT